METWTKTGACRGVSGWEDEVDLQLRLCVPQRTTGTLRLRQFQGDNWDLFPQVTTVQRELGSKRGWRGWSTQRVNGSSPPPPPTPPPRRASALKAQMELQG